MLVALLLPAVQAVRENARQTECMNNLKNIALATVAYDTSRGQFPGYSQLVPRGRTEWAVIDYDGAKNKFVISEINATDRNKASAFSWATVLLSKLERADIWDQIVQPPLDGNTNKPIQVELPVLGMFICPSDTDARAQGDRGGMSYSANTGAWDRASNGNFLGPLPNNQNLGDIANNGVFFNLAEYEWAGARAPKVRMGSVKDGASTTLMLAENVHKTYVPTNPSDPPLLSWPFGTEQQLGICWVVDDTPQSGPAITDQEAIGGNTADVVIFPADTPLFARPAGTHGSGANVAFCDGHTSFLRSNIDYVVYQQLMTPNGRKCVDPRDHTANLGAGEPITVFRTAPPLSEGDYQ
ncbi:MAG: DUF1559 domain-containing protein [Planctomycetes bacterium]|nr:DUF1559 domain-containing protein [Planctomycetota bacterium]